MSKARPYIAFVLLLVFTFTEATKDIHIALYHKAHPDSKLEVIKSATSDCPYYHNFFFSLAQIIFHNWPEHIQLLTEYLKAVYRSFVITEQLSDFYKRGPPQ